MLEHLSMCLNTKPTVATGSVGTSHHALEHKANSSNWQCWNTSVCAWTQSPTKGTTRFLDSRSVGLSQDLLDVNWLAASSKTPQHLLSICAVALLLIWVTRYMRFEVIASSIIQRYICYRQYNCISFHFHALGHCLSSNQRTKRAFDLIQPREEPGAV
jgi:hypothetical protein